MNWGFKSLALDKSYLCIKIRKNAEKPYHQEVILLIRNVEVWVIR
jgi:hypothetical protein